LKLKELISKNKDKVEDVKRRKEKADDREKKEMEAELQRDRKELEAELQREKRNREYEVDGDWHCGDAECRFINFKKNFECKNVENHLQKLQCFGTFLNFRKLLRGRKKRRKRNLNLPRRAKVRGTQARKVKPVRKVRKILSQIKTEDQAPDLSQGRK